MLPILKMNLNSTLLLKLFLAIQFLMAGQLKIEYGMHAPEWFAALDFPFPQFLFPADFNWVLASWGEIIFPLMLFTPWSWLAALGLIYICLVAINTSHFGMGWSGWNDPEDGFKIPLMYILMLFTILYPDLETFVRRYIPGQSR